MSFMKKVVMKLLEFLFYRQEQKLSEIQISVLKL